MCVCVCGGGNVGINRGGFGLLPPPPFFREKCDITLSVRPTAPFGASGHKILPGKGEREGQTEKERGVCVGRGLEVCVCVCVFARQRERECLNLGNK